MASRPRTRLRHPLSIQAIIPQVRQNDYLEDKLLAIRISPGRVSLPQHRTGRGPAPFQQLPCGNARLERLRVWVKCGRMGETDSAGCGPNAAAYVSEVEGRLPHEPRQAGGIGPER